MAHNPDLLDPRIWDKTETCRNKFRECSAHPKLNRQAWLETGQAEFNVWTLGLNAPDFGHCPLNYKIRRRAELRDDITDLLDALDECLSECLDPDLLRKIDDKSMLSLQDDPKSPLYYNIYNIEQILQLLWVQYIEIREFGTRFRYHKVAASLKSNLNKSINSLKDYTTKAVVAGLEIWSTKEKFSKPSKNANKQLLDRIINLHARKKSQVSLAEKTRNAKACQMEDEERSAVVVSFVLGPDAGEEAVQLERQQPSPLAIRDFPKKSLNNHILLQERHLDEEFQAPAAITISSSAPIKRASFTAAETTTTKATGTVHENICLLSHKCPGMPEPQHISYTRYSNPLSWIHLLQWAWM